MSTHPEENYKRGEEFESFVAKYIFPTHLYDLVEKTHSYAQNSQRYVESSMKPDFKFRCKQTGQEFFIEAKFRAVFDQNDKVPVLKPGQEERYKQFDKKESPVFLVIGVGGTPPNPESISLLPLTHIKHPELFKSVLKKNSIDKNTPFDPKRITEYRNQLYQEVSIATTPLHEVTPEQKQTRRKKNSLLLASLIVLAILFLGYGYIGKNASDDTALKGQIEKYYVALENNNTEVLNYFINENVERWYNNYNVDLKFIKHDAFLYNRQYPTRKIKVDWSTFIQSALPNGDYNVSYDAEYKIKANDQTDFRTYFLNIKSIWTKDLKIRSMYEERL